MKNKINQNTNVVMLLALTAITALCMTPVRAGAGNSSHGGGSSGGGSHGGGHGGGGSGGGTGGGPTNVFYPTVTNDTQLSGDINYANQLGGTYSIYLQPNTTFSGGLGIGGPKNANVTIIGDGDTFDGGNHSRLFVVGTGSSLTLEQVTLQNGYIYENFGGAIYNSGMLTISNCILSGNTCFGSDYVSSLRGVGGAVFNAGTVIIDHTILSNNLATGQTAEGGAIYNQSGTMTISNSTFINNKAYYADSDIVTGAGGAICNDGMMTISDCSITGNNAVVGGGVYNGRFNPNSTVTIENSSTISGNTVDDVYNFGALYLDSSSEIDILDGNSAIPF